MKEPVTPPGRPRPRSKRGPRPLRRLWPGLRAPHRAALHPEEPAALADAWPRGETPGRALRPAGGPAAGRLAPEARTILVTALGVGPEALDRAARLIRRQQLSGLHLRPVFVVDRPDDPALAASGYTQEYLPPAIYGRLEQSERFAARFHELWRKWKAEGLIDFSARGFLARRLGDISELLAPPAPGPRFDPRRSAAPRRHPPADVAALRAEYLASPLASEPDSFVLYRILGNDLPPRHEPGQTLRNLRFILDHEPALPGCERRWLLNRITDPEQETEIIALLDSRNEPWMRIPFRLEEYAETDWDLESFSTPAFFLRGPWAEMDPYARLRAEAHARRHKNNYVMNNNGARNAALEDGRGRAKWVLPWDGNCFVTKEAWREIVAAVTERPWFPYFTVPMARTLDNAQLLDPGWRPEANEEPQIIFRRDAIERFDERYCYGRRPKVALLWRLGVPGPWDSWGSDDLWDLPRPELSPDAGSVSTAGWVARLFSGEARLETAGEGVAFGAARARGEARVEAIVNLLDRLDIKAMEQVHDPAQPVFYDPEAVRALAQAESGSPARALGRRLLREAQLALRRGPWSVTQKTELPPSGNPHDYYHPAPYWWPNPATPDGMPHVWHDGKRVPGTRLYEPESERYDRTRLQRLFDDTTLLALAWLMTGEARFAGHGARLLRCWFLDPETRMTPHLEYAQVRHLHPGDVGAHTGIIEMKDLYYFLDAVRILEFTGAIDEAGQEAFRDWLRAYATWLQESPQGQEERLAPNNHGTCYDLQLGAIAAFLGDHALLHRILSTSRERILEQFTPEGRQPHEMKRTQTRHYTAFNLQSWINLATLAEACGHDLWRFEAEDGRGLAGALGWLLPHMARADWPHEQIEPFERRRYLPLFEAARSRVSPAGPQLFRAEQAPPLFFPHDGIRPFWMLSPAPRKHPETPRWQALAPELARLEEAAHALVTGGAGAMPAATSARELERMLWGGFSAPALAAMERQRDDPATPARERHKIARALARWHSCRGEAEAVLADAAALVPASLLERREAVLIRAWALAETGSREAAEEELASALRALPEDPELHLARADLAALAGDPAAAQRALERLHAHAPAATALGPGEVSAPRVSVILDSGGADRAGALASILGQSLADLEVIVPVGSAAGGAAGTDPALARLAAGDPRVRLLEVPGDMPPHEYRNRALAQATGSHVTLVGGDDRLAPGRLALMLAAIDGAEDAVALARTTLQRPDGRLLPAWQPGFTRIPADRRGILLPRPLLLAFGGWDAAPEQPEAFLFWRLTRPGAGVRLREIAPEIPLATRAVAADASPPSHQAFAHGPARVAMRRLLRLERALLAARAAAPDEAEGTATDEAPLRLPPLSATGRIDRLGVLFMGDFGEGAPALDLLQGHIERALHALPTGSSAGIFHWPAVPERHGARLADEIAALVDQDGLLEIAPGMRLAAERLVLCTPWVLGSPVDGVPEVQARAVELLGGPELVQAELAVPGAWRIDPEPLALAHFGLSPVWTGLAG